MFLGANIEAVRADAAQGGKTDATLRIRRK
jgi:hypothetical protein